MLVVLYTGCWAAVPCSAQEKPKPAEPPAIEAPLTPPQSASETSGDYNIGPGDVLDIRIIKQADLSGKFRVNATGNVTIPLLGQVQAAGLTEPQLAELLRTSFQKYIREPQVYVAVAEYAAQAVTVIGAIAKPGKYPVRANTRLLDVLLAAGGMSPVAGDKLLLIRNPQPDSKTGSGNETQPEGEPQIESINIRELFNGQIGLNRSLQPGDILSVPEAAVVYVIGQVNKPGSIQIKSSITFTQAVYQAGGVTALAAKSKASLLRVSPNKPGMDEIRFNLADIEKKKVEDPILQPGDVVYLRDSEPRNVGINFYRAFITGIAASLGFIVIGR
ncbi:MAG: polysaccharide biosynthesis/export family protein [Blastocatellia bacterium]|nr:polysaccharide biosynthesis/export family protein [Blastocatellia bacterium]